MMRSILTRDHKLKNFKKSNIIILIFSSFGLLSAQGQPNLPIQIVTTNTILQDMVKNIGGERVKSQCLVKAGTDSHSFDPSPADLALIASAHLFIINGLHLEDSLKKLIANSGYSGPIVEAASHIPNQLEETDSHGHNIDPHAWHDLSNGISYVQTITDALIDIDPSGVAIYGQLSALYVEQIRLHDTWAKRLLLPLPKENRYLVSSHQSLQYLANAYGLVIHSIEDSNPQHEPDVQSITELIHFIREHHIQLIFTESGINRKFTEQIASEAGINVGDKLFTDSLAPSGHPADTYLGMFRFNITRILRHLHPETF